MPADVALTDHAEGDSLGGVIDMLQITGQPIKCDAFIVPATDGPHNVFSTARGNSPDAELPLHRDLLAPGSANMRLAYLVMKVKLMDPIACRLSTTWLVSVLMYASAA